MRLQAGACSDKGRVRSINEDSYACDPSKGLFVVCDGMGGEAAGEVASQLAIETIVRSINNPDSTTASGDTTEGGFHRTTRRLESAVRLSNQAIYEESQENAARAGMGTTVVGTWIRHNIASLAHVGDSRAYLWRQRSFEQLTRDHSLVEEQVQAGLLTREQSLQSSQQNILLRALGREAEVEVDLAELPLMTGDYLVLCSDGLTRMVDDATLADTIATLEEPQKICDSLVALANQSGGEDNITVVIAHMCSDSLWRRLWNLIGK
jgi:serine/threonine protein phosphatase PrpC